MTIRHSRGFRVAAGTTAAALLMCAVSLVGTANAAASPHLASAANDGAVGARVVPLGARGYLHGDPSAVSGFQLVPFLSNDTPVGSGAGVSTTVQITVGNGWTAGDQLKVVLPAGVSLDGFAPQVEVEGPTTQQAILTHATTVIVPAAGVRKPTLAVAPDTTGREATLRFTNSSTGRADTDARFVLNVGLALTVRPAAQQGALVASIFGTDGPSGPQTLLARTTLAFITNLSVSFGSAAFIPGGGAQTIGPITLSETQPGALVDGTYTFSFLDGETGFGAQTPVPVADPNPRGTRFDVGVNGASLGAGGATANGNTLTVSLTGLHAGGKLETVSLAGVRLDPPAGSTVIRVALTRIADPANPGGHSPSSTQTTFNPVNTPNAGNPATGVNTLLPNPVANESRVATCPGLEATNPLLGVAQDGRIGGDDRYATAAQVAQQLGRDGEDISTYVIASGDARSNGADALSANYLAGALARKAGAPVPVLLTQPGALPDATAGALHNLLTARRDTSAKVQVYVIGGASAVSPAAVDEVRLVAGDSVPDAADVSVTRLGGADRYATAGVVATEPGAAAVGAYTARFGQNPSRTVFLSNGLAPADALSAGPIAYRNTFPVLLSRPGSIPRVSLDAMRIDGVRNVILLGGTSAVSEAVVTQLRGLGLTVTRVAGADRYGTNTALYNFATRAPKGSAISTAGGLGYRKSATPLLTNGLGFADALTAGPLAAEGTGGYVPALSVNSPLLLTSPKALSTPTEAYLTTNKADTVTGIGLTAALPESVLRAANNAARGR